MGWGFVRRGGCRKSHPFIPVLFPCQIQQTAVFLSIGPEVRTEAEDGVGREGSLGPWQLPS